MNPSCVAGWSGAVLLLQDHEGVELNSWPAAGADDNEPHRPARPSGRGGTDRDRHRAGGGHDGGRVIFEGPPAELAATDGSLTGRCLRRRLEPIAAG
jgi:hypothetical protein